MPQPPALDDLQEPLLNKYRMAWTRVQMEQDRLVLDPLAYRRRARLTEMRRAIELEMSELDREAAKWIADQLPDVYKAGMFSTPDATSTTWTQIHREAVEELGVELFDELLAATDGVRDSTKQLVRVVGRDEALAKAMVGKTAREAAQEMRRVLSISGIHSVTYSDGSKHGLAEYTQVAMRTTTAKAYNRGTLNAHQDVKFFEVFDGPSCGLSSHDDPRLAMGMVIGREEAEQFPISHPNCRRAFGPRPDVTRSDLAEKANPTSTAEQRRAQLEQDAARGDREAQRELAQGKSRQDVFEKREARLAEQRERYRRADREAAEKKRLAKLAERDTRLAARAEKVRPSDLFPEFPKLAAGESYADALKVVNPGLGVNERRNNCHFVAPSMELRARGYDVVASPTFRSLGRFTHSIESDWVDPTTGQRRKFQNVQIWDLDPGTKTPTYVAVVESATATWPPGARGFVVVAWKKGGAHIFNAYKDDKGVLKFVDGQVQEADAKDYLRKSKTIQVMRVDDLQPVQDRLKVSTKPRPGDAVAPDIDPRLPMWKQMQLKNASKSGSAIEITTQQQIEVALDFMQQYLDDYSTAPFHYQPVYTEYLDKLERELKQLGIKEPYVVLRERREAKAAAQAGQAP